MARLRVRLYIASSFGSSRVRLSDLTGVGKSRHVKASRQAGYSTARRGFARSERERTLAGRSPSSAHNGSSASASKASSVTEMSLSSGRERQRNRLPEQVAWLSSIPGANGAPFRADPSLTVHEVKFNLGGVTHRLNAEGPFAAGYRRDIYKFSADESAEPLSMSDDSQATPMNIELCSDGRQVKTQLHVRLADGRAEQLPVNVSIISSSAALGSRWVLRGEGQSH